MSLFTFQVEAEAQDSDETEAGTCSISAATTILKGATAGANKHRWALRAPSVTIPKGATITNAVLKLWAPTAAKVALNVNIFGVAEDSAAALAATSKNLQRSLTKETQVWNATLTSGAYNSSPDFHAVMQEVINRSGWASGNALALILGAFESCECTIEDWDNKKTTEHSAILEITYTTGTGFTRTAEDTISVSDSATRGVAFPRTAADTVSVSESSGVASAYPRTVADTVAVADAAAQSVSRARTAADSISVSDQAVRAAQSFSRTAGDTVTIGETASRTGTYKRSVGDTITVGDSASATFKPASALRRATIRIDSNRQANITIASNRQVTISITSTRQANITIDSRGS